MSHYFDSKGQPGPGRSVRLSVGSRDLDLKTSGGVFSRAGIDAGTQVLLELAPPPAKSGDLLDIGCGYGPLALTMATLSPNATVWAVDVNLNALALCAANAADAGLTNVRVCTPDDVPSASRYATIWSNPPIRIGRDALRGLLARWLAVLAPDGAAFLVVQRHLGSDSLHAWLDRQGWPTERVGSRKGYRVLRCTARPGTSG